MSGTPLDRHARLCAGRSEGDHLRKARETVGMNQTELANALVIARLTVGRLETGQCAPKRPMVMTWAVAAFPPSGC
ncbi:helix-turn-helix transcriptional regulator [Rothia halotolerans]|uniref:helix-turn-helix transcriptional regulator n=1 Tax=Rothia halotolerans TaxID=405770 RepID=UPI003B5017C4